MPPAIVHTLDSAKCTWRSAARCSLGHCSCCSWRGHFWAWEADAHPATCTIHEQGKSQRQGYTCTRCRIPMHKVGQNRAGFCQPPAQCSHGAATPPAPAGCSPAHPPGAAGAATRTSCLPPGKQAQSWDRPCQAETGAAHYATPLAQQDIIPEDTGAWAQVNATLQALQIMQLWGRIREGWDCRGWRLTLPGPSKFQRSPM